MNIVFIYGPTAVGKLTVAEKLSKLTGYKLLHNHLFGDLIGAIFPYNTKEYHEELLKLRPLFIGIAAKNKISGLIFTFRYKDEEPLRKMVEKAKGVKANIFFVQLTCLPEELMKRVTENSRKKYNKICNKKVYLKYLKEQKPDFNIKVPYKNILAIDNTSLSADKAAKMIKEKYKL